MYKLLKFYTEDELHYKYNAKFNVPSVSGIVASLSTDELKTKYTNELIDKGIEVHRETIIESYSSEELKFKEAMRFSKEIGLYWFSNIVESINDEKIKEALANEMLKHFDITKIRSNYEIRNVSSNLIKRISKGDEFRIDKGEIYIPYKMLLDCEGDFDFSFFNNEIPEEIMEELLRVEPEEARDFLKFAKVLGCFSREPILDSVGKETDLLLGQKASSLLVQLLKTKELKEHQ